MPHGITLSVDLNYLQTQAFSTTAKQRNVYNIASVGYHKFPNSALWAKVKPRNTIVWPQSQTNNGRLPSWWPCFNLLIFASTSLHFPFTNMNIVRNMWRELPTSTYYFSNTIHSNSDGPHPHYKHHFGKRFHPSVPRRAYLYQNW